LAIELNLRIAAREIFDVALAGVDSGSAVRNAVRIDGPRLSIRDTTIDLEKTLQPIYALAIGKAAFPMAIALEGQLGQRIKAGLVVGTYKDEYAGLLSSCPGRSASGWQLCEGAHPLPDDSSLNAAQAAFSLLRRADDERALVIFMISGGGSSMIEWPLGPELTVNDIRVANRELISSGASISEINAIRRSFSDVKGGRLAKRAPNADQITLVISDTPRGQESIIASGPTCDPSTGAPEAREVLDLYGLEKRLPLTILDLAKLPPGSTSSARESRLRQHYVLLDNKTAVELAKDEALRRGFAVESRSEISEQQVDVGSKLILSSLAELRSRSSTGNRIACLISGGEFSCPVRGNGVGGRNAETALRLAIEMDENRKRNTESLAVLSAGTDGVDGNSPAAGAIATDNTIERAKFLGLDPTDFLDRSDAFTFFNALDDTVLTGPTGTNVRDLRIAIAR